MSWEFLLVEVQFGRVANAIPGEPAKFPMREELAVLQPADVASVEFALSEITSATVPISPYDLEPAVRTRLRQVVGLEIVVKYDSEVVWSGPLTGWTPSGRQIISLTAVSDLDYLRRMVLPYRLYYDTIGSGVNLPDFFNAVLAQAQGYDRRDGLVTPPGSVYGFVSPFTILSDNRVSGSTSPVPAMARGGQTAASYVIKISPGDARWKDKPLDHRDGNVLDFLRKYAEASPVDATDVTASGFDFRTWRSSVTGAPRLMVGQYKPSAEQNDAVTSITAIGRDLSRDNLDGNDEVTLREDMLADAFATTVSLDGDNFATAVRAVGPAGDELTQTAYSPTETDVSTTFNDDNRVWYDHIVEMSDGNIDTARLEAAGLAYVIVQSPFNSFGNADGSERPITSRPYRYPSISEYAKAYQRGREEPWVTPEGSLRLYVGDSGVTPFEFDVGDTVSLDFDTGFGRAGTDKARVRRLMYRIGAISEVEVSFY